VRAGGLDRKHDQGRRAHRSLIGQLDLDSDSRLSRWELDSAARFMRLGPSAYHRYVSRVKFRRLDSNEDGRLQPKEFRRLRRVAWLLDLNGDGVITLDEFDHRDKAWRRLRRPHRRRAAQARGLLNSDRLVVDGTQIKAWASMKSFVRKDGTDEKKIQSAKDDDPGNPTVNFRGEKRSNATHQSTSDPESVLYRKAAGKESKLCFGAQVLMENRNGLCAAITVHNPIAEDEPTVALAQVDEHRELHEAKVTTVGGDKAYHQKKFVAGCREREIAPHVACKEQIAVEGLDGRTTRSSGYEVSQRLRKRVEEILGWMKTVGGMRRSRYRGVERTQAWVYLVASSYNLLRMAKLGLAAPT